MDENEERITGEDLLIEALATDFHDRESCEDKDKKDRRKEFCEDFDRLIEYQKLNNEQLNADREYELKVREAELKEAEHKLEINKHEAEVTQNKHNGIRQWVGIGIKGLGLLLSGLGLAWTFCQEKNGVIETKETLHQAMSNVKDYCKKD